VTRNLFDAAAMYDEDYLYFFATPAGTSTFASHGPVVPGAGSAFFMHVSAGKPTAGCVSIPADDLKAVMAWLDPAQHPVIDIAVK